MEEAGVVQRSRRVGIRVGSSEAACERVPIRVDVFHFSAHRGIEELEVGPRALGLEA